jgi:hypothetical protein
MPTYTVLLTGPQGVLHGGLMGLFDHSRHRRIGDRPQGRHRLHRRERQVIPGNCLCPRPRIFRDLCRQFPRVNGFAAMLSAEELSCHLSPHPRPVSRRDRGVGRPSDGGVERGDALGHLEPKRAQIVVDDLERRPQPRHILKVLTGEVGPFQLLLPQLGQRMQTAAKQGSHLLRGHRVASGKSVDPAHPGTDPHAWRLAAFGVVGHQPGVTFLGRVQGRDLPGQIVISGPGCELVDAHRHTHPKGYEPPGRSGRPELLPAVHQVCRVWDLGFGGGTKSWTHVEGDDRWRCSRVRSPVTTADHRAD